MVALASKMRQGPEPPRILSHFDQHAPRYIPDISLSKATRSSPHERQTLDRRCESGRKSDPVVPNTAVGAVAASYCFTRGAPAHRFAPTPGLNFPPVMEEPGLQVLIPPPSEGASDLPANNRNQPFYKLNFHLLRPLISGRVPGSLVGAVAVLREATRVYRWLFSVRVRKVFLLEFQLPRM